MANRVFRHLSDAAHSEPFAELAAMHVHRLRADAWS